MHYKTAFISDIHLGSRGCKAEQLISFLKNNTFDELYLIGDIIDGWRMNRRKTYWPQSHTNVIRRILTASKRGTKVYYIIGNHDEFIRQYLRFDLHLGNIKILNQTDYTSVNGEKYLIIHGDLFDNLMRTKTGRWLMYMGDNGYDILIKTNDVVNWIRKKLGFKYWSLSKYIKHKTKKALDFVLKFEEQMADYAGSKNYDGVICGHIHTPCIKIINGIKYYNDGDWVENCSALVEHYDGTIEIVYWNKI